MATSWGEIGNKLILQAKARGEPIIGQFELTSRCNLRCKMCYVCESPNNMSVVQKELPAGKWIKLAEQARDAGMFYLLLTGGEVLIRKDFREIYENISMMGLSITIYSNATLVTPEFAKWLGRIPPGKFSVTLYGASPETYERVCGNGKGFEQALKGIDFLLAEGINVDIKTTIVRGNEYDLEKIGELASKREIAFGMVNYISPRREGCYTDPIGQRLTPDDSLELGKRAYNYFKRRREEINSKKDIYDDNCITPDNTKPDIDKISSNKSKEEVSESLHDKVVDFDYVQKTKNAFQCSAGNSSFWVTYDGRMLPCGLLNEPVVYPFDNGFLQAWEDLKKLCREVPVCKECEKCSLKDVCGPCPAKLKAETGCFNKPAPYLCELAKRRKTLKMDA